MLKLKKIHIFVCLEIVESIAIKSEKVLKASRVTHLSRVQVYIVYVKVSWAGMDLSTCPAVLTPALFIF